MHQMLVKAPAPPVRRMWPLLQVSVLEHGPDAEHLLDLGSIGVDQETITHDVLLIMPVEIAIYSFGMCLVILLSHEVDPEHRLFMS
jgi:hypothetical protein